MKRSQEQAFPSIQPLQFDLNCQQDRKRWRSNCATPFFQKGLGAPPLKLLTRAYGMTLKTKPSTRLQQTKESTRQLPDLEESEVSDTSTCQSSSCDEDSASISSFPAAGCTSSSCEDSTVLPYKTFVMEGKLLQHDWKERFRPLPRPPQLPRPSLALARTA